MFLHKNFDFFTQFEEADSPSREPTDFRVEKQKLYVHFSNLYKTT